RLATGLADVRVFDLEGDKLKERGVVRGLGHEECRFAFTADGDGIVHVSAAVGLVRFWSHAKGPPEEIDPIDPATVILPRRIAGVMTVLTSDGVLAAASLALRTDSWSLADAAPRALPGGLPGWPVTDQARGNRVVIQSFAPQATAADLTPDG